MDSSIILKASFTTSTALQLTQAKHGTNSLGTCTRRIEFHLFDKSTPYSPGKIALLAIRELSKSDTALLPSQIKLGLIERFFWKPISIQTSTGTRQTILVNINSAIKRLGALGFTTHDVHQALNSNSLGDLLVSSKLNTIKQSTIPHGFFINPEYLENNIKKALIYIQDNKLNWETNPINQPELVYDTEISYQNGKIEITIGKKYIFDFDSGQCIAHMPTTDLAALQKAVSPLKHSNQAIHQKLTNITNKLLFVTDDLTNTLKTVIQDISDNRHLWNKNLFHPYSSSVFLSFNHEDDTIQLNIVGQLIDYDKECITSYVLSNRSNLSHNDIEDIYKFLSKSKEIFLKKQFQFIKQTELIPRPLCITNTNDVFVLLDRKIASTSFCTTKFALNLTTGEFIAASTGAANQMSTQDAANISQTIGSIAYKSKFGVNKCLILSTFCYRGNLDIFYANVTPLKTDLLYQKLTYNILTNLAISIKGMHARGLVYNGITPTNILLQSFSVGKQHLDAVPFIRRVEFNPPLNPSDTDLFPFRYLAPEQLETSQFNQASDIWSLGCIFYEVLMGQRLPWTNVDFSSIFNKAQRLVDAIQIFTTAPSSSVPNENNYLRTLLQQKPASALPAFVNNTATSQHNIINVYTKTRNENPYLSHDEICRLSLAKIIQSSIKEIDIFIDCFINTMGDPWKVVKEMLSLDPTRRPNINNIVARLTAAEWPSQLKG
ncbi:MAG: protein kinase [Chlamydiales bacterium]|nr:protein kinase [Chlamydiales bacterium]